MSKRCAIYVRVSTDDQRDNGYSIDSQLRMIKEYCEKNDYSIIDVYNDAGYSGKDLMRPEMQRLLKDIKAKKIDKLISIKVDRLTRNNYDGFWLLNYCEQHDVKIELILEPYDVGTANGEMIFGMNLVFGQRERKEIGARTKRAMEEMALSKIHPSKAPYGYVRNKETGHLEIEPIEALVVKQIFELCKNRNSTRNIANILNDNNAYLKEGKWRVDRVYKILTNSIYIGIFEYGKYKRKQEDILRVENYCEPIIDMNTWNVTRTNLEKNKHPNYGEHIHLFTSIVKCPECSKILSSTISYKYDKNKNRIEHYHLTCKNPNCKSKGLHYSSDKIEKRLGRILNELTRYMYDMDNEIIVCNSTKSKDIKDIDKAIEKLKLQEKRLVDLYISSTLPVDTINNKNETIKKEIQKLNKKKELLNPDDDFKGYVVELVKKIDCDYQNNENIMFNKLGFSFVWDSLKRQTKKELIQKLISNLEITRDKNYNIEIKNIKFSDEFISKSNKEYLEYLNDILQNDNMGIKYHEQISVDELSKYEQKYYVYSLKKYQNNEYSALEQEAFNTLLSEHFYYDGIINCPLISKGNIIDNLMLIPKTKIIYE
ncbi:MAG: recombinase family protein [Firmicutes bacterium]|nr:recombinase family protein [Bacillota bacterium]